MGGHGGLNILPQKRWNVYNFENREKVRKDEEEAAREEEANRAETRRRDSESRLQQLRQARGIETPAKNLITTPPITAPAETESDIVAESELKSDSKHINLFEGIKIFDAVEVKKIVREDEEDEKRKKKKAKKEEVRVVGPEDEKYRLGYGVAGKGVKAPWYATRRVNGYAEQEQDHRQERKETESGGKTGTNTKKTIEELREERLKREKAEKERVKALLSHKHKPRDRERRHRW